MATTLRAWFRLLSSRKCIEDFLGCCWCQILLFRLSRGQKTLIIKRKGAHVEIVTDNNHRCVATRSLAFDLNHRKLPILCRLAWSDSTEVLADGVQDFCRTSEHTRCCGADLNEVFSNRFPKTLLVFYTKAEKKKPNRLNMV